MLGSYNHYKQTFEEENAYEIGTINANKDYDVSLHVNNNLVRRKVCEKRVVQSK